MKMIKLGVFLAVLCTMITAVAAQNMFHIPDPNVIMPGEEYVICVMGQIDTECKGYSLSFRFNPAVLEILECVCDGCPCADAIMVQGCEPADLAAGMFKLGVVYSISCPPAVALGEHCLVKIRVRAKEHAFSRWTRITFEDIDLSKNRLTACDGSTLEPITVDKRFKIGVQQWQEKPPIPPRKDPGKIEPRKPIEP